MRIAYSFSNRAISCSTLQMYALRFLHTLHRTLTSEQVFGMFTNAQLVMDSFADTLSALALTMHY